MAATLRVATWNIRAAIGPGPFPDRWWSRIDADRLRAIGAFIPGLDVDVLALQEVALLSRDGELVDNPGELARQLGLEVRYGAVRSFEVTEEAEVRGVGCFGNAILTRRAPGSARTIALPRAADDALIEPTGTAHPAAGVRYADASPTIRERRSLLVVRLDGLRIGTAHFSHVGSAERLLQAEATAAALGQEGGPAVLLGDLNAPIEAAELAPLRGWTDAFTEPPGDPARRSTDDGVAIDHVLGLGVAVRAARVVREAGALSDHYPVVAEVELDERAPPTSFVASSVEERSR